MGEETSDGKPPASNQAVAPSGGPAKILEPCLVCGGEVHGGLGARYWNVRSDENPVSLCHADAEKFERHPSSRRMQAEGGGATTRGRRSQAMLDWLREMGVRR